MPRLIVYYVHPGHRFSQANAAMWARSARVEGITRVDLYAAYPRFHIDVAREQARLMDHDIIAFQFPLFWYSTPALLKEWQDLVLEHGFAYGKTGTALAGKALQLAVTAAGPREAYDPRGSNRYTLREYLRPLEQTARLCHMTFPAPYVLNAALKRARGGGGVADHVEGYARLLEGLRDGTLPAADADTGALLTAGDLLPEGTVQGAEA